MKNTKSYVMTVIVLMAVLIFSMESYISFSSNRTLALEQGQNLLLSYANKESALINREMEELGSNASLLARTIGYDSSFTTDHYNEMIVDSINGNDMLFGMGYWMEPFTVSGNSRYFGPYYYDDGNRVVSTWDYSNEAYDYHHWHWYIQGLEAESAFVFTGTYYDALMNTLFMTASSPIVMHGMPIGVVTADITLAQIEVYLKNLSDTYGVDAFIITAEGDYLHAADFEHEDMEHYQKGDHKLEKVIHEGNADGLYHDGEHGEIVVWSPIGDTSLKLVMTYPENQLYGDIYVRTRNQMLHFFIAVLIFGLILNRILTRRIEIPLKSLISATMPVTQEEKVMTDLTDQSYHSFDRLIQTVQMLLEERTQHIEELQASTAVIQRNYRVIIRTLSNAIEAKDRYTRGHCDQVTDLSVNIGRRLGLTALEIEDLEQAAQLHDIGKISVPTQILNKPSALTNEEFDIIKSHPMKGYEIIMDVEFLKNASVGVLQHHERPDGKGYPCGLTSDEIHIYAKIISVADAYDAMTRARAYRKEALPVEKAIEILLANRGTQFDAQSVDALVMVLQDSGVIDQMPETAHQ